jgi:phospholipid/cholesterol/gamma-HCH transport system substrate-binding protein
MDTRTPHWRVAVLPVLFALACIVLTIAMYSVFGGTLPFEAQGYRVTIPFAEAPNLVPGSGVQISGVKIGKVISVDRAGNDADVKVQLQPGFAPLRTGATAIARTKTLLGEGFVEIAPGSKRAPAIPDGGRLAVSHVMPQVQLDQFISTFGPATRQRMRALFTGLQRALAGKSRAVNDSIANAAPFTTSLDHVLDTVQNQRSSLAAAISNGADVLGALGQREGTLQAAISSGNEMLSATAARSRGLAATIDALPAFLHQLHSTADSITDISPSLNVAVSDLQPSAERLKPALQSVDTAAPVFRSLFAQLPGVLTAGRTALPALTSTVTAARYGLTQFYPTARNLIPFMQLFGESSNIVDILANVAAVTEGTSVGSGGLVIGSAPGVISVWNETISGWTHKLPTNRQNAYPKPPDSLLETGTQGVLDSYDCRNTHNPLILPATGIGAPPCILQGPWTFDGKSAYYPRLQLAGP